MQERNKRLRGLHTPSNSSGRGKSIRGEHRCTGQAQDSPQVFRPEDSTLTIWILIPTWREARRFAISLRMKRMTPSTLRYEARGIRVFLRIGGIGLENAHNQAKTILDQGCDFLVLAGFCGGLEEDLKPGDLIIDNQLPDPRFTRTILRIARARSIPCREGKIHTSHEFVATPAEMVKMRNESMAPAVDMEGAALLDLCRAARLPFRSFRAVSDSLRQDLPKALQNITLDGRRTWRFWRAFVSVPREWPLAWQALDPLRAAEKKLFEVLSDWVRELPETKEVLRETLEAQPPCIVPGIRISTLISLDPESAFGYYSVDTEMNT